VRQNLISLLLNFLLNFIAAEILSAVFSEANAPNVLKKELYFLFLKNNTI
jgi:hypothetical protein